MSIHTRMTQEQFAEFDAWFDAQPLGELEDVRDYVRMYSLENVSDVPADDKVACAKSTVEMYVDDKSMAAETFRGFRNN